MSGIKAAQPLVPLEQVAPGVWMLRANLVVEGGAQLVLHGTPIGGDLDVLRLQSNNTTNSNAFVFITADWGSISIRNISVTSWDDAASGPDTEYATYGRAFISVRSRLAADGVTPQESQMDIADSDIGYLGYDDSEGCGLTWKVVGGDSAPFDRVNVRGDIENSRIHHNFSGIHTIGGYGMHCLNNEIFNNVQFGLDLHDDSDYLFIQGNNAHDNGNHGILVSQRCDHLALLNNKSWANGQAGIIIHRGSDDCDLENNQCVANADSGIILMASSRCTVRSNLVAGNLEAGIRLNLGSADNLIQGNECASNLWHGLYLYRGDDLPEPNDDGRPKRNKFLANQVHDNGKDGINLADSDENAFATNVFRANSNRLRFQRGTGNRLDGNVIGPDITLTTEGSPTNAASTYVRNQLSLRVQLDAFSSTIFEDQRGRIFDPEEKSVPTGVTTNGSRLLLTAAEIGATSTVIAQSLWAHAAEGMILVDPLGWTNAGPGRQWSARATAPVQNVDYTMGDLGTNSGYAILKDDVPLTTVKSDPAGMIHFTDALATTNEVRYSIGTNFPLTVKPLAGRVAVSWMAGRIQRATRLANPDWHDVPVTNGQFRINIKASEPMEFFRLLPEGPPDANRPPGFNFDLSHWKLTLPDAGAPEISADQLMGGFTNSFFYTDAYGAMTFWCPVTGGTTIGSDFPRCELRELLNPGDETVNWTGYGTHILDGECRVMQVPTSKRTFVAQIHSFLGEAYPLVKLRFDNGDVEALVRETVGATNDTTFGFADVGLGNLFSYQIKLEDGVLTMTVDGVSQSVNVFETDPAWTNQTFYFKAGNYCQDNLGTPDEGAIVSYHRLSVTHGNAVIPAGIAPRPLTAASPGAESFRPTTRYSHR